MDGREELQQKIVFLKGLEQKFRRFLLDGENKKALDTLVDLIEGYKSIEAYETVNQLEIDLINLSKRFNLQIERPRPQKIYGTNIMRLISGLEKKVKRRLLQGKTEEAISDLNYIIVKLREIGQLDKAELLESSLNEFLKDLSGESKVIPDSIPDQLEIKVVELPELRKSPVPPTPPLAKLPIDRTASSSALRPNQVQINQTLPEIQASDKRIKTIKDQPLSEEERIIKELFEINEIISEEERNH